MGWVREEMKGIDIGDKRLNKRATTILEDLSCFTSESLTQAFKSRAELIGAYRLFDNSFVTPEKILSSHYKSTLSRMKEQKVVLLLNDTSSIDYTSKKSVEGLGILETAHTKGLFIHPVLALTPDRICLGLVNIHTWSRDSEAHRKSLPSQVRNNQPIEEKESFRWIHSYRVACKLAQENPQTQYVSIGDRESDILELIVEAAETKKKHGADIIIRVNHDRALPKKKIHNKEKKGSKELEIGEISLEDPEEETKLKKKLLNARILGNIEFTIPERKGRAERKVIQTVRAVEVQLKGKKVGDKNYPSVKMNAVCCIEENPPDDEDAICWMFFTTLPIDAFEQVLMVIKYYLCRWDIEIFFKILKSGCKIEEKELKTAERIKNMMAIFFILAWRIMYIMGLGRKYPDISCAAVFEESEWKSVSKIIHGKVAPNKPPTLGNFILMVARLGGYIPGKNRPPPGAKVLWKGMRRMSDFALAWENFV